MQSLGVDKILGLCKNTNFNIEQCVATVMATHMKSWTKNEQKYLKWIGAEKLVALTSDFLLLGGAFAVMAQNGDKKDVITDESKGEKKDE